MNNNAKSVFLQNTAIFTVTHNRCLPPMQAPFYILQAGAALTDKMNDVLWDDSGMNISQKNQEFCELTALYWVWKNDRHDIVGLNHYRRFFILDPMQVPEVLQTVDVIAPIPYYFRWSLTEEYCKFHVKNDLLLLMKLLDSCESSTPNIIKSTFENNQLVPYNMFIASRSFTEQYCEWLFPILFQLEDCISLAERSPYQKRVFGFLAERLFTYYLQRQNCRVHWCPVSIPEKKSIAGKCKFAVGQMYNRMIFNKSHTNTS